MQKASFFYALSLNAEFNEDYLGIGIGVELRRGLEFIALGYADDLHVIFCGNALEVRGALFVGDDGGAHRIGAEINNNAGNVAVSVVVGVNGIGAGWATREVLSLSFYDLV